MSQTIDSRVVEMKFDNRDFEKNVAESMKTLDNLNKRVEKLENTQVDFGKISKGLDSLNFDKLDKALDSITHRFSVMGQIGASAIQSITQGALNLAKSGISNVWNTTFGQIKSGGMSRSKNIENAKFLLEGTGVAFEKVESSINNAVLDTAFGFDEAAKAAAGLAAAGVQVGNSMDTALLSISGVAAMTNRSYSDIADIFQDAAAAGKASADTFGRLAERGLAAKSIMMDYLKITSSDEFDKLAKKGGITFDKFAQAMYDNFAAQAKKSNETLDGVVANCKAALSRMGQTFYQPLMANNSEVVLMLQTLKKQLNEIKKITDPLAEHMANYVLSLAKYLNGVIGSIDITKLQPISDNAIKIFDNLTKALENIYSNILKPFGKAFKDALYEAFPSLNTGKSLLVTLSDKLVEGSQKIREFTAEIGLFGEKNVALKEILKGIFELLKSFVEIVKNLAVALKPLLTLIGSIAKALVSLIAGLGPVITSALSNLPGIINIGAQIVAGILSGILSGATTVGGAIITLGKIIVSAFTSFFIIHSPSRLMALAVGIPIAAGIAAGLILGKDKIIEAADALGETLRAVMEKAVDTMFIPFEVVGKKFKGPIEKFKDFMHALGNTVIFKPFVELLKILGSALELINLTLRRTITLVANLDEAGFGRLLNQIKGFVVTMVTMFSLNKLSKAFTAFSTGIGGIGKAIQKGLNSISSGIKAYARAQVLGKLGDIFKNLAIAVATITAAILVMGWAIGDPDRWERIQTSLWIIGGIVGALTAIVVAFGILATNLEGFKSKNMAGVATAFVAIAASIWLVAGSLKKVGNMGLPQLITGFIGIIVMFAAVAYAMHKFKSNSNGIVKSDWLLILSFGLTISMIAKSLVKVALVGFFSKETLWNAAGVILSIVGVFGLIAVAMEGLSKLEIGQVGNLGMLKEMPLTFLAMGVAVYAIASAIKKLSKIKQADLDKAYDKILAVMLLIEAVILTAHFVANDISQLLYSMAALVVACGLIIKYIGAIENTDVVDRGMWVLGKLAVGILGFIIGIELITKRIGGGTSDLKTLLYIAALITACGAIIAIVGNMKPQAVIGAMATLLVLGAGILAFIYALDKITRKSTQLTRGDLFNLHKSGKKGIVDKIVQFGEIMAMIRTVVNSIVKLSITMAIVSRVIKNWEDLAKAIIILGAVMVPIVGTILLLDQVDTGGGENIKGIAKVITAMCLAILMISGSLLVLSQMPLSSLWSAGAVMGIIIGMVALLASQLKESKNWKNMGYEFNTKAITGIVFAIAAIGVALTALTMFNQDENGWLRMAAAGVAIGICIAAVGFAVEKMSGFEFDKESAKAVLIASLSLVAVAGAIWIIAQAKWDDYWKGLASAAGCIVVLGIVLVALNKLKIEKDNAWTLVIACGALLVLAGVIAIISQFEWEKYAPGLGLMGLCILAIAAALRIAQGADWKTALTLGIGCLSLLPAAFALSMIADYDWYAILAAAVGMAIAIGAVGAILIGLAALASASGGIGAGLIIAIAGALVIASLSLVAIAGAMLIAAEAAKVFVGIFTPETAQNILGFFNTLAEGLKPAAEAIMKGIKAAIQAIEDGVPEVEAAVDSLARAIGDSMIRLVGTIEEIGISLNEALNGMFTNLKKAAGEAGTDFVGGFLGTIMDSSKKGGGVWIAAAALGLAAVLGLRSEGGIDAHSWSRKTIAAAADFIGGFFGTLNNNTDVASDPAAQMGANAVGGLVDGIKSKMKEVNLADIWNGIKTSVGSLTPKDWAKGLSNPISFIKTQGKVIMDTVGSTFGEAIKEGAIEGVTGTVTGSGGGGIMDAISSFLGGSGNFSSVLSGFDWQSIMGGQNGIGGLKGYLEEMGVSMDNLSGDNIPKLIEKLKEAGFAGDGLINALKELGITEDQLKSLGLADALGIEEAKDGVTEVKDVVESIIKGDFGNAPERWDRLFEYFIKQGKTAQEAYAAIADAQNAVNEKLGSNVRHTAAEMEKAVSDSVKKANEAAAKANEGKKEPRDFKKDPYNAKPETAESKAKAASEADKNMMNNMPYENYRAIKEGQITKEKEKQTVEAYKQKLANEHIYTLKEKEAALAGIKANQERLANSGLTEETRKQLEAENQKYQKVVDTYNTQRDMIKAIEEQETATKKAEDAEKKRGEAVQANNKAVVYGSDEYWNTVYKNNKNSTKAVPVSAPNTKVETPIASEAKVEVTPKLEVKTVDVTEVKEKVVQQIETEVKDVQAKIDITPKINTSLAENQIRNFKTTLTPLKVDIPKIFEGIADAVSTHINGIASKITQEGTKISTNTKTVFQNAVSAAITTLNSNATINKFYNAGLAATQGYVNGIKKNLAEVRSAGATIANTAVKATKAAQKSQSPSKVFYALGGYAGEGYTNGILGSLDMVANASDKMAEASINELYSLIEAVNDSVEEGMDITPTIVPVVDTSEIQNSINYINSSLGRDQTVDIMADINASNMYKAQEAENMQMQMSSLRGDLSILSDAILNQPNPEVTANVNLIGDADGVFKLMQQSNNRYTKMHGKSAFA